MPTLSDRVVARALRLAIYPSAEPDAGVLQLIELAGDQPKVLTAALQHLRLHDGGINAEAAVLIELAVTRLTSSAA